MDKRHNFASFTRPLTPDSVEKTKWELYLEELGLGDETAIHALRHGTGAAAQIRAWVRTNCRQTFVPEDVLEVLGIEVVLADLPMKRKEEEIW
jgi:hypothetical protein